MRARFIGDPRNDGEGPQSLSLFGVDFVKDQWAQVPASAYGKLSGNRHFELDADEDGEAGPTAEEMRAELRKRGIKFHHNAGAAKLAGLLNGDQR